MFDFDSLLTGTEVVVGDKKYVRIKEYTWTNEIHNVTYLLALPLGIEIKGHDEFYPYPIHTFIKVELKKKAKE